MTGLRTMMIRTIAVLMGLVGLFFVFYTARLLYVTHGLTVIRAGGNGTYIGAVAFPLLAMAFGLGARQLLKRARHPNQTEPPKN